MKTVMRIILLILLCTSYNAKCQDRSEPKFNNAGYKNLNHYIEDKIHPIIKGSKVTTICMNSASFCKFDILENGQVGKISFTLNTPLDLIEAYKSVLYSTNGRWEPQLKDGKSIDSDPFLLPIMFYFTVGCNKAGDVTNDLETPIRNILKFDDGVELKNLKCIILPPAVIGAID